MHLCCRRGICPQGHSTGTGTSSHNHCNAGITIIITNIMIPTSISDDDCVRVSIITFDYVFRALFLGWLTNDLFSSTLERDFSFFLSGSLRYSFGFLCACISLFRIVIYIMSMWTPALRCCVVQMDKTICVLLLICCCVMVDLILLLLCIGYVPCLMRTNKHRANLT